MAAYSGSVICAMPSSFFVPIFVVPPWQTAAVGVITSGPVRVRSSAILRGAHPPSRSAIPQGRWHLKASVSPQASSIS